MPDKRVVSEAKLLGCLRHLETKHRALEKLQNLKWDTHIQAFTVTNTGCHKNNKIGIGLSSLFISAS